MGPYIWLFFVVVLLPVLSVNMLRVAAINRTPSIDRPGARKGVSRRAFIITGLVTGGLGLAGGGFIWWRLSRPSYLDCYRGHSDTVDAVAWSPDGTHIASASADQTVQVWGALNGNLIYTYRGHSSAVNAVAWSPDGTRIASASGDQTVQVWDATNGGHIYTYHGHSDPVYTVAWSPDSTRIASGGFDGKVQVWDAAGGRTIYTYRGPGPISSVAWSPDGARIASAAGAVGEFAVLGTMETTVQVWDATDGGHVYTYSGHTDTVYSVAWSPAGKSIASASRDKTVQVWGDNWDNTMQPWDIFIYTYKGHTDSVLGVAWSPSGTRIASASADQTVQVWGSTDGGQAFTYRGHSDAVYCVEWSPAGTYLASGGADKTAQVWQAPSN